MPEYEVSPFCPFVSQSMMVAQAIAFLDGQDPEPLPWIRYRFRLAHHDQDKPEMPVYIAPGTFPLLALPFEIRTEILYLAVGSTNNFWLDREAISLRNVSCLQDGIITSTRTKWLDSKGSLIDLLLVNKQIQEEVEWMLYSRFIFEAKHWVQMMRTSDPSSTLTLYAKERIQHIAYSPGSWQEEDSEAAAALLLDGLPNLLTVRILVPWDCVDRLSGPLGDTKRGTQVIVALARAFQEVGKVAVIGQSMFRDIDKKMLADAREELKGESWYWELDFDYPLFVPFYPDQEED